MQNPWKDLPKPLLLQAPMEDVTDTVFRQMLAKYGKPDIFFTEFTNVDGVFSKGKQRVIHRLKYNPDIERPIMAQIWGHNPENYYNGAKYVRELGFDGIDINMGCPQRKVVSKGLCAALIEDHEHAGKIIQATIDGAGGLPVSVKTRIGVREIVTEEWIRFLLGFDIAAVIVHGRTVQEKSKVPCHWDEIGKAVQVRNAMESGVLVIGNGDVRDREDALTKVDKYGVDGVMIARGLMENVQAFKQEEERVTMTCKQAIKMLREHLELFRESWGDVQEYTKNANVVKKFVKVYIKGFDGAKELRTRIMECETIGEMESVLGK